MRGMNFAEVEAGSEQAARMMNDPRVIAQQKLDGVRVLAHLGPHEDGGVIFRQRGGEPLKFAAAAQHLRKIHAHLPVIADRPVVFDGELMIERGEYRVFDLIFPDQLDMPYLNRLLWLDTLLESNEVVQRVKSFKGAADKDRLFRAVEQGGGEGVMLKHADSTYRPGTRVSDVVKVKFVKTAEVIVLEVNRPDAKHGSATLGAFNARGEMVKIGACSLIGKPHVEPGDVIEVRYLYNSGTSLAPMMYQPRMSRVRDDQLAGNCTTAQFPAYTRQVFA